MNKLFYFIGALCTCSCAQTELVDSYAATATPDGEITAECIAHEKHNFLGVGYDATEAYLSDTAVKLQVIDLSKIPKDRLDIGSSAGEYSVLYAGETSEDYVKDISRKNSVSLLLAGKEVADDLFSGTILNSSHFSTPYSYSSQYSFASCDIILSKKRFQINAPIQLLQQSLTQTFIENLATLSADQFVKAYGTHILMDVCTGGRIRGFYRSLAIPDLPSQKAEIVQIGLVSSLDKTGIFSGFLSSNITKENIAKNIGGKLALEFHGGSTTTITSLTEKLINWPASLNEENAVLTSIAWDWALPIYELISDPVKKEQIKEAVTRRILQKKLTMPHTAPMQQYWNGNNHLYSTDFSPVHDKYLGWQFESPICSVHRELVSGTVPLYWYSNGKNHRFTLDYHPEGISAEWTYQDIFGYVYADLVAGAIPLYQAYNGDDYCYTTEFSSTYGVYGSWKNEGIVCYVLPLMGKGAKENKK